MSDILLERQGWGNQTTGGANGANVIVNDLASLRAALESPDPAYITFAASQAIALDAPIYVKSNKTLDGRGKAITLKGTQAIGALWLEGVENIIISDIVFDGQYLNWTGDADGAHVDGVHMQGAKNIWVHHCRFTHWSDDAIGGKPGTDNSFISITWNRIEEIYKPCLMNGGNISFGYNYVRKCGIRFPKANVGGCHVYNNVIEDWQKRQIEYTEHGGQIYSHRNMFIPKRTNEVGTTDSIITFDANKSYGSVKLIKKSAANAQFIADSKAVANVTICNTNAQWDALRDKVKAEAGPRS